jgi:glutathionyl-hydroquinone reductase
MAAKMFSDPVRVDEKGNFLRPPTTFRNWIGSANGEKGVEFPAAKGRYHLYVSLACPWACRTLMLRSLKGLQSVIDVTVVDWLLTDQGNFTC